MVDWFARLSGPVATQLPKLQRRECGFASRAVPFGPPVILISERRSSDHTSGNIGDAACDVGGRSPQGRRSGTRRPGLLLLASLMR